MEQMLKMLKNYLKLQRSSGIGRGSVIAMCALRAPAKVVRGTMSLCLWDQGAGAAAHLWGWVWQSRGLPQPRAPPIALVSHFPCYFWQCCKEKSAMLLEMGRKGAATRISGSERTPHLQPSRSQCSHTGGRPSLFKIPFFLSSGRATGLKRSQFSFNFLIV